MVSEPFASDFDHALLQRSSLRLACEQRTFRAPFALRFPPSLNQTAPTFGVGHLLLATKDRRSFLHLKPEFDQAAEVPQPAGARKPNSPQRRNCFIENSDVIERYGS